VRTPAPEVFGHQKLDSAELPPRIDVTDPPDSARAHAQGDRSPGRVAHREPGSVAPVATERMRQPAPPQSTKFTGVQIEAHQTSVIYTHVYALLITVDGAVVV